MEIIQNHLKKTTTTRKTCNISGCAQYSLDDECYCILCEFGYESTSGGCEKQTINPNKPTPTTKASGCSSYNSDGSCYGCRSGYVKVDGICKKIEVNKGEKYNNSTACTNAGCKWHNHTCKCESGYESTSGGSEKQTIYGCKSGYVKVDGVCKKIEVNKGEKYNNSTACTNAGCKWSNHTCKC